jgi:hypothetical protein
MRKPVYAATSNEAVVSDAHKTVLCAGDRDVGEGCSGVARSATGCSARLRVCVRSQAFDQ